MILLLICLIFSSLFNFQNINDISKLIIFSIFLFQFNIYTQICQQPTNYLTEHSEKAIAQNLKSSFDK